MERVSKLGLEAIQLEDQVLLANDSVKYASWVLSGGVVYSNRNHYAIPGVDYEKAKKVISSTKPLDGLPLLVIEDEIEVLSEQANGYAVYGKPIGEKYLAFKEGFIEGHNKARETYKFTEEDMGDLIEICIGLQEEGRIIKQIDAIQRFNKTHKKELWVEVELSLIKENHKTGYTVEKLVPKITNNQIKAIWK